MWSRRAWASRRRVTFIPVGGPSDDVEEETPDAEEADDVDVE